MEIGSAEAFVRYYENIRSRTKRVIGEVPPDRLEWRPVPHAFSFGDLPDGRRSGLLTALDVVREVAGLSFVYFDERDVVDRHGHVIVQNHVDDSARPHKRRRAGPAQTLHRIVPAFTSLTPVARL